ncbi:MAG TPA: hypothetical protein VGI39_46295 [Polyangiaceae bacterium]|jgi:predicted metal-dependent HD superfamily phosphohydrolase
MDAKDRDAVTDFLSFDCPAPLLERLRPRYAEPHRRYHTWAHILACLKARRALTETPSMEVDLAILFHDAIYDPLRGDNEARSAALLLEEGRRAWLPERTLERAAALVGVTRHDGDTLDSEEAGLVLDADLSILGCAPEAFATYEAQVRCEYAAVDDARYAVGRAAVLSSFLARPSIYVTRRGRRLWEAPARANLERSLRALSPS